MKGKLSILLIMLLITGSVLLHAQENLVANGGFEQDDVLGNLVMWEFNSFVENEKSVLVVPVEGISRSGKRSLLVLNYIPNDTRAIQWIHVKPNTIYKLSAWVLPEQVGDSGTGPNISVFGSIFTSENRITSGNEWQNIWIVGRTGPEQNVIPLVVRLGFFSSLSYGKVYFDDIEVVELDSIPDGKVIDFSKNEGTGIVSYKEKKGEGDHASYLDFILIIITGILALLVVLLTLLLVVRGSKKPKPGPIVKRPEPVDKAGILKKIERRRSPRKKIKLAITLSKHPSGGGYEILELQTLDMSETGIMVSAEDLKALNIDDRVSCEIKYRKKKYDVGEARVVRKEEIYDKNGKLKKSGFGLTFTSEKQPFLKNRKTLLE